MSVEILKGDDLENLIIRVKKMLVMYKNDEVTLHQVTERLLDIFLKEP